MVVALCLTVLVVAAALSDAAPPPAAPLQFIAGSARKMRMYIKNTYLQLEPDGTVSGVRDDASKNTVFQRSSVTSGQVKIQGVATCMYLCMNTCGIPYAGKEFTDECVFNETIQQHNYNTYSSAKYSNSRRTLYLGLNKMGLPRRVQIRAGGSLGKLSASTRVLPLPMSFEEAEEVLGGGVGDEGKGRRRGRASRCLQHRGPIPSAETGRCRRPRRPRRRKRKRCKEGMEEECRRAWLRRALHHRVRHRKHRTAEEFILEDPQQDDEEIQEEEFIDDSLDVNDYD